MPAMFLSLLCCSNQLSEASAPALQPAPQSPQILLHATLCSPAPPLLVFLLKQLTSCLLLQCGCYWPLKLSCLTIGSRHTCHYVFLHYPLGAGLTLKGPLDPACCANVSTVLPLLGLGDPPHSSCSQPKPACMQRHATLNQRPLPSASRWCPTLV